MKFYDHKIHKVGSPAAFADHSPTCKAGKGTNAHCGKCLTVEKLVSEGSDIRYFDLSNCQPDSLSAKKQARRTLYLSTQTTVIADLLDNIISGGNCEYPSLQTLAATFHNFHNTLRAHLKMEEKTIYPYIQRILIARQNFTYIMPDETVELRKLLRSVWGDHQKLQSLLGEVNVLALQYSVDVHAPEDIRHLPEILDEFQEQLTDHMQFDEVFYYPKALLLEEELHVMNLI